MNQKSFHSHANDIHLHLWQSDWQLFQKQLIPQCFRLCARTDIDVALMEEMECAYKCMITYKQAYKELLSYEKARAQPTP